MDSKEENTENDDPLEPEIENVGADSESGGEDEVMVSEDEALRDEDSLDESDDDSYLESPTKIKKASKGFEDKENGSDLNDNSDMNEEEEDGDNDWNDDGEEPSFEGAQVIVEEGYLLCSANEIEPGNEKAIVQGAKLEGLSKIAKSLKVEGPLQVSLSEAFYPPLKRRPEKGTAFYFNGHKYYSVKGSKSGIMYYMCSLGKKGCPVRCKIERDCSVVIRGSHSHPPKVSAEELKKSRFRHELRELCRQSDIDTPLSVIYCEMAAKDPEGSQAYPFYLARRLMRHAMGLDRRLVGMPTKQPKKVYTPAESGREIFGKGYFLEGYKYYKMKQGRKTTYYKCSRSKAGCHAMCRVMQDGSAVVSGDHIHGPTEDGRSIKVQRFKEGLLTALGEAVANQNDVGFPRLKDIYDYVASRDTEGAKLYPYSVAKHFLYKKRGRFPKPTESYTVSGINVSTHIGSGFLHDGHKYILTDRIERTSFYKCSLWKEGCEVEMSMTDEGSIVLSGEHFHSRLSNSSILRLQFVERLKLEVAFQSWDIPLRMIYDSLAAQYPEESKHYSWKLASCLMEKERGRLKGEVFSEEEEIEIREDIDEAEFSEYIDIKQTIKVEEQSDEDTMVMYNNDDQEAVNYILEDGEYTAAEINEIIIKENDEEIMEQGEGEGEQVGAWQAVSGNRNDYQNVQVQQFMNSVTENGQEILSPGKHQNITRVVIVPVYPSKGEELQTEEDLAAEGYEEIIYAEEYESEEIKQELPDTDAQYVAAEVVLEDCE